MGDPVVAGPIVAFAPGRVNLIGDHVDYMGGLVLPMAIDLGTTVRLLPDGGDRLRLESADDPVAVDLELPIREHTVAGSYWGRLVAAVAAELGVDSGVSGDVTSTLPLGAGLSSSTSLVVALAVALGALPTGEGTGAAEPSGAEALARTCRRVEAGASGVPCGIMDQLTIACGVVGAALLIDCAAETVDPVELPEGLVVHAVHSGVRRELAATDYAQRRAECERAEAIIGPLREASEDGVGAIDDPVVRRRARHVVTEIARVEAAVAAARAGDVAHLGKLMDDSHASLRDDFEVSTPGLDHLVENLRALPGVHGARLTGAGFGGCVVAVADAEVPDESIGGWRLKPSGGARLLVDPCS